MNKPKHVEIAATFAHHTLHKEVSAEGTYKEVCNKVFELKHILLVGFSINLNASSVTTL